MDKFIEKYFTDYKKVLDNFLADNQNKERLDKTVELLKNTPATIYLVGNGGSAAVAEHMAVDLTKNAGLRALAFTNSPMLTAISNDCGYEYVFQKAISYFANKGDILIAISSGGTSQNILNACLIAKQKNMKVITFLGFNPDNTLRKAGDINFWVDTKAYGYVELLHNLLIHYINDAIIGSAEYTARG